MRLLSCGDDFLIFFVVVDEIFEDVFTILFIKGLC